MSLLPPPSPSLAAAISLRSVYQYLCHAVRNFARDRGEVSEAKDFYVAFEDVPARHKSVSVCVSDGVCVCVCVCVCV